MRSCYDLDGWQRVWLYNFAKYFQNTVQSDTTNKEYIYSCKNAICSKINLSDIYFFHLPDPFFTQTNR